MPRSHDIQDPLLTARTRAMAQVLAEDGVTHATYVRRVLAVADAAAEQADFTASLKGYELIGKTLGIFAPETHLHRVLSANPTEQDLARMSDDQLRALCKPADAVVVRVEEAIPDHLAAALA